jgi:hypothetical protein
MKSITHMVIFCLKHDKDSLQEKEFISYSREILSSIPVVRDFKACRQTSPKNGFDFGFTMKFKDKNSYEEYNNHPSHQEYVNNRWLHEVDKFLEIDFEEI